MPSLCNFPLAIGIPIPSLLVAWQPNTVYSPGTKVINDSTRIYNCVTGGTSAPSGGPTGTGTGINDNGVIWDYVAEIPGIPTITIPTLTLPPCVLDEF